MFTMKAYRPVSRPVAAHRHVNGRDELSEGLWRGAVCFIVLCMFLACTKPSPSPTPDPEPEPEPETVYGTGIVSMSVAAGEWTLECGVDTLGGTITLFHYEEDLAELKSATATVVLAEGASITPDPANAKDYRKGATFIVTSQDGKEQVYTLSLSELQTPERPAKPVVMWIDAENSMQFLSTREKVAEVVRTAWETGFSGIVMDVKSPKSGDVLYTSEFLGYCPKLGNKTIDTSWDVLQELADRCHELGMTISASVSVMTFPRPETAVGQAYFDENLADAVCQELLPTGVVSILDDDEATYKFLNPAHPATRSYMVRMVSELARNYDLDGIALDYCRFPDIRSDFSDFSRAAFEEWVGSTVDGFPDAVLMYSGSSRDSYYKGPRIKEWAKWRSSLIRDCVKECRDAVKAIKPSVKIECWAEGWWWDCWMKGQNWASQNAALGSAYSWAASDYMETGYAEYLDIFHLGAYVSTVYGYSSEYTMEYLANYGKKRILDACTLYGSFGAYNSKLDFSSATIFNYRTYDGMMIFELGSVRNRWGTYKAAIRKAMRLEGEYPGRPSSGA